MNYTGPYNQIRSRRTWLYAMGFLMFGCFGWLGISAIGKMSDSRSGAIRQGDTSGVEPDLDHAHVATGNEIPLTGPRYRADKTSPVAREEEGHQFPLIDQILANDNLAADGAAAQLLQIVLRQDVSLLEREEALAHGLNLDFPQFMGLAGDSHLPQPLAQKFFDAMLNYNSRRDLQVRACISLVDHDDPTIREEAAGQLAFYIGLEEWTQQPEILKQEGYSFLEEWAKRPTPGSEVVYPAGDIPQTKPIQNLEALNEHSNENEEE